MITVFLTQYKSVQNRLKSIIRLKASTLRTVESRSKIRQMTIQTAKV